MIYRQFRILMVASLAVTSLGLPAAWARAQEDLDAAEEQAIRTAVERVAPSVVRIETLGGLEKVGKQLVANGPTSGLVVSPDGFIVASAFAFIQQPTSILVTLPDGKRTAAKIVARDRNRMLVLLKVEPDQPLPVPEPVPRDQLAVGQWTIAIGRTFTAQVPNVSIGILSAVNRIWGKAVQTDAKISPSNYGGALADIQGRVIGVLVPLSQNQQTEVGGAEWYDSGIGFAVPLTDILARLDTWKTGHDLLPGLLGVSLKGTNIYALPATIAACPVKSPAYEAGLRVGDTIVEVDGARIERQSQLKHALGARYAGDTVRVVAERANTGQPDQPKQRIEAAVQLVDKVPPYIRPALGVLPMRDPPGDEPGVVVRAVEPDSAAAATGLQPGDRIIAVGDTDTPDAPALRDLVAGRNPAEQVPVHYVRAGQRATADVTLGRLNTALPADLPPAHADLAAPSEAPAELPAMGLVDIKIPEEPNDCFALVPENYDPRLTYGLLVWLPAPGTVDRDELATRWQTLGRQHDFILLVPQARDAKRWSVTEVEFVRKTIDDIMQHYSVDPTRVVVHGYQAGGAMSYLVAFAQRDVVRGVAVVDAPLPARVGPVATDPGQPLAVYSAAAEQAANLDTIQAGEKRLSELEFPVTAKTLSGATRYLNSEELAEFARWLDALDRI